MDNMIVRIRDSLQALIVGKKSALPAASSGGVA
jgi:hypothetical protein